MMYRLISLAPQGEPGKAGSPGLGGENVSNVPHKKRQL